MIKAKVDKLCADAEDHIYVARKCLNLGDYDEAERQLCALMTGYVDYFSDSAEESPEQQQDDSEDEHSADEEGCVVDSPHDGYVRPS